MKALHFQTKRDNVVIYAILIGLVLLCSSILVEGDWTALNGGTFFVKYGSMYPMLFAMIFVILIPRICGWDATDKTINYEIMAGHSRKAVYFGRVIVGLLWTMLIGIVMMILPLLVVTVMNGWGENINLGAVMLRCLLVLFPLFRFLCELILLTVLMKNCYVAMLLGWVFTDAAIIASMVYTELTENALTAQLAVSNLTTLFTVDNYKLEYIGGEDILVYSAGIRSSVVCSTILVSLLVGATCLIAGYVIFRKRDMN